MSRRGDFLCGSAEIYRVPEDLAAHIADRDRVRVELSELRHRFGNLGLAAAAYNAGEKRVEALIAGKTSVPLETRNYVFAITGRQIGDWLGVNHPTAPYSTEQETTDFIKSCSRRVRGQLRLAALPVTGMVQQPWGVQIFESFSRTPLIGDPSDPKNARAGARHGVSLPYVARGAGLDQLAL